MNQVTDTFGQVTILLTAALVTLMSFDSPGMLLWMVMLSMGWAVLSQASFIITSEDNRLWPTVISWTCLFAEVTLAIALITIYMESAPRFLYQLIPWAFYLMIFYLLFTIIRNAFPPRRGPRSRFLPNIEY